LRMKDDVSSELGMSEMKWKTTTKTAQIPRHESRASKRESCLIQIFPSHWTL
jgi:hypothetical protein